MGPVRGCHRPRLEIVEPIKIEPPPQFLPQRDFKVRLAHRRQVGQPRGPAQSPAGRIARGRARDRFGATMVELDYNHDGKPDLFLLAAVVEKGQVRDLLLRNDGEGLFNRCHRRSGLGRPSGQLGCCVGDFDNNEFPDVFITGAGRLVVVSHDGKGGF